MLSRYTLCLKRMPKSLSSEAHVWQNIKSSIGSPPALDRLKAFPILGHNHRRINVIRFVSYGTEVTRTSLKDALFRFIRQQVWLPSWLWRSEIRNIYYGWELPYSALVSATRDSLKPGVDSDHHSLRWIPQPIWDSILFPLNFYKKKNRLRNIKFSNCREVTARRLLALRLEWSSFGKVNNVVITPPSHLIDMKWQFY